MINTEIISLRDLFVNVENFMTAFDKVGDCPASYSSGKPLDVAKLKNGKLYLWNGHHRIADEINKYNELEDILNLQFKAKVYYPNGDEEKDYTGYVSVEDWVKENVIG